jgi:sodium-dependent dicarboxylate transporter 2/3/5
MHARHSKLAHLVAGPSFFLALAAFPLASIPYQTRCGFGLLLWMSWWWVSEAVPLAVTGFLPLVAASLFDFVPVAQVLPAYAEELIVLLLGANVLSTVWSRWGLDRRIAMVSLIGVGTSTRRQILVWFSMAMLLSAVLPNVVVAAAMIPIILAMLRFIGIDDVGKSPFATSLLIAVAWGTSVGGFWTPLGGAPNLLTIKFLKDSVTQHEILFSTWVMHMLPLSVATGVASLAFMSTVFKPEITHVEGTREFFSAELRSLGPMSVPEKWGLALFLTGMFLAFTRQFYAAVLPGFNPAYAFLTCAVLCFVLRHGGEPLVTWKYAQQHMEWGLFYLFAGGTALGVILSQTGAANFTADLLAPLAGNGGFASVLIFSLMAMVVTQITSNTAAVAIIVPITIATFQSLGTNPIPFVYITSAAANCGLMLPSSAGGPAVAAGYGVHLGTMFTRGLWLAALLWVTILVIGYLCTFYWPAFSMA